MLGAHFQHFLSDRVGGLQNAELGWARSSRCSRSCCWSLGLVGWQRTSRNFFWSTLLGRGQVGTFSDLLFLWKENNNLGKDCVSRSQRQGHLSKLITIETETLQAPVLSCILESSGLPGLEGKVVLVTGANTGRTKILTRNQPTTSQLSVICQKGITQQQQNQSDKRTNTQGSVTTQRWQWQAEVAGWWWAAETLRRARCLDLCQSLHVCRQEKNILVH